jgi:hypothetical protein
VDIKDQHGNVIGTAQSLYDGKFTSADEYPGNPNTESDDAFARRLEQVRRGGVMTDPPKSKPLLAGKPSNRGARSLALLDYGRKLTPEDLGTADKPEPTDDEPTNRERPRNVPPKVKAHRRKRNKLANQSKRINRAKARR